MLLNFGMIAAGLILLFFGGEKLVEGSVAIAQKLGLSTLLISMVIIGFGTSAPELLVSLQAALTGSPDLALGNVIGSNICNTLLVMGVGALIAPILCDRQQVKRDALVMTGGSALLASFSFLGVISLLAGALLFGVLAFYISYSIWNEKRQSRKEKRESKKLEKHIEEDIDTASVMPLPKAGIITLLSFIALAGGAKLLVTGAVSIARGFGVSEAIIGLTIVALGTSLPELATAIVAARKKHGDVIIGNVLGSNMFNILGVLGLTAIVTPIPYTGQLANTDVWVMLGTAIMLLLSIFLRQKLTRIDGIIYLSAYAVYLGWLAI